MTKPDSIIFDMDGTLWDALETYVLSWNKGLETMNVPERTSAAEISEMMGWDSRRVLNRILPNYSREQQDEIYGTINRYRAEMIASTGGKLYDGVREGLTELSRKYKLFILSNCPKGMIRLFIEWAKINHLIVDEMAYGVNEMPKHHNIRLLSEKHTLQNPVYVGDTDGDRIESEKAGVPFVFVSFGFGKAERYDLKFDTFGELTNYFLEL
jgi:phosphoglycolate phosphatase